MQRGQSHLVRSLGADHTIDYATGDATDGSSRYDLILDIAGNTPLRGTKECAIPRQKGDESEEGGLC